MDRARVSQVILGFGVISMIAVLFVGLGWLAGFDGFIGEFARMVAGVFTTPILLEPAFLLLGLLVILAINHWRQHRDGPDWVYLDQVTEATNLPEQARFAVYENEPLDPESPGPLAQAEGALAIGDLDAAAEVLAELSPAELDSAPARAVRIRLARATGRDDLAAELERNPSSAER